MCPRCKDRPVPEYYGSPRRCAFENGAFNTDNWACETMMDLRSISFSKDSEQIVLLEESHPHIFHNNDQNASIVQMPEECEGDFLILGWYKSRGRTEAAWVLCGKKMSPLNLRDAELFIDYYSKWLR